MKSKLPVSICLLFVVVFFIGCVGLKGAFKGKDKESGDRIKMVVPRRLAVRPREVPRHVKLATSGLVLRMRHRQPPGKAVVFSSGRKHRVREKGFDYSGFRWTLLDLTACRAAGGKGGQVLVHLEGLLHFADSLDRRSTSSFAMDYVVGRNRPLEITSSRIVHVKPVWPRVKAYFVPLAELKKNLARLKTFRDYYRFAATHFVSMYASARQAKAKARWDSLSAFQKLRSRPPRTALEGDWAVMIFCLDRLAPDSLLDVKVISGTGSSMKQVAVKPAVFDEHGWKVIVVTGHGRLHDSSNPFRVDVFYRMEASPAAKPLLVGRFDSRLDYSRYRRARAAGSAAEGPLALGRRLLDPARRHDARLIQQRLKELGYYRLKVDGSFGRGSRASLRAFNREVLHVDKYRWDIEVQKALFKGSGL